MENNDKIWNDMLKALKHYAEGCAAATLALTDNDGYEITIKVVAPRKKSK